jgi:predicted regulator of Ras-like GTPase activity (Roadblock/LC7/MglB family)
MRSIFGEILQRLVDQIPGSRGAVFADWEGETVDLATRIDKTEMSLIAAHWGIVFFRSRSLWKKDGLGAPNEILMRFEHEQVLIAGVGEDYFVALTAPPDARLLEARSLLAETSKELLEQM